MPEHLDISAFVADARRLPARRELLEMLLQTADWLGAPGSIMRLDYKTSATVEADWAEDDGLLSRALADTELLFVYAAPPPERPGNASIGVDEKGARAAYTVSVPRARLVHRPLAEIEDWVGAIYGLFSSFAPAVVYLASESGFDVEGLDTMAGAIEHALGPNESALWVAFEADRTGGAPAGFEVARQLDGGILLRRVWPVGSLAPWWAAGEPE